MSIAPQIIQHYLWSHLGTAPPDTADVAALLVPRLLPLLKGLGDALMRPLVAFVRLWEAWVEVESL